MSKKAVLEQTEARQMMTDIASVARTDQKNKLEVAECILRDICERDQKPNFEETMFFQSINWDERRIAKEVGRMGSVMRHQRNANTSAEREAARSALREAASLESANIDRIADTISKLEGERVSLETATRQARATVERQADALRAMRSLAPEFVKLEYDQRRGELSRTIGKALNEARDRLNLIDVLTNFKRHPSKESFDESRIRYARQIDIAVPVLGQVRIRNDRTTLVEVFENHPTGQYALPPSWDQHAQELRGEIQGLESSVKTLEAQYDSELAALSSVLDVYSR